MKAIIMPVKNRRRTLLALLTMVMLPIIGGALISPYIFNILLLLGRNHENLQALRNLEFESVATRTMLIGMLLAFWPALNIAGNARERVRSLFAGEKRGRQLLLGVVLGVGSMALIPLIGLWTGAYHFSGDLDGLFLKGIAFLFAGLLVAFLEEFLFRGVLFDMLWRLIGLWAATFAAAMVFSLAHFINPIKPAGVVHGHWYSGFRLLWRAVMSFDLSRTEIFPYCLTLFAIAISLCVIYSWRRNLYVIAGIHAGWIWVLKMAREGFARGEGFAWLFGNGMVVEKSYAAMIVSLLFCAVVVIWRIRFERNGSGEYSRPAERE